ncbi:MAG: hydrogenase 3 maturation endopeptidase HyCI [Candidatus Bathyarchaeia archaeon]
MKTKSVARKELKEWLLGAERIVIVGVGNPIFMDDSVGIKLVQDLRGRVPDNVLLIECETTPENYLQEIMDFKPTHVLIVDAALLDLKPGEIALSEPEDLKANNIFSTHFLPVRLFCEYITKASGAKIKLLLIQPKEIDLGEELSPEVFSSKEKIVKLLLSTLSMKNRH